MNDATVMVAVPETVGSADRLLSETVIPDGADVLRVVLHVPPETRSALYDTVVDAPPVNANRIRGKYHT